MKRSEDYLSFGGFHIYLRVVGEVEGCKVGDRPGAAHSDLGLEELPKYTLLGQH
jgi:hypothetical protein